MDDYDLALVFSGGNALGAFEAGVYEALHDRDLLPDWIVGASIGAINGAIIAGSVPDRRVDTLQRFWRPDASGLETSWSSPPIETARRSAAVAWTMAAGRAGIFGPALSSQAWWPDDRRAVFETEQLAVSLGCLIDFDQLNDGPCRFTATAVDLANGDDVVFDSRHQRIEVRHVRASAALPVAFPPVEIDGRWLVDGGMSANLPLDPVMAETSTRPMLCIAVDLLPLCQPFPTTLGEAASRMQDLVFAAQSRRTIARWKEASFAGHGGSVTLLRIAYTDQGAEVAGKAFDFSPPTVRQRWSSGYKSAQAAIKLIAGGLPAGAPGLTIVDVSLGSKLDH